MSFLMIEFYKYQGTGNDFILIDNRSATFAGDKIAFAQKWCERRFGIGSDGVIFLEDHPELDFYMDFYNPDGSQSFCGNGSRCVSAFARFLGMDKEELSFEAIDGKHVAVFTPEGVKIKMGDVQSVGKIGDDLFIDTGSPHYISYRSNNDNREIVAYGRKIRYSENYREAGTNVNLVEETGNDSIRVETYERGVENETFACGTGATACGLSFGLLKGLDRGPVIVDVKGGRLKIHFQRHGDSFTEVWLEGPATYVFKGKIDA